MTYAALKKSIIDYCETDEPTFLSQIDNFITTAEFGIYSKVMTPDARFYKTGTVNTQSLSVPTDFKAVIQFMITVSGQTVTLLPKGVSFIREAYTTGSGQPRFYALLRQEILSGTSETMQLMLGPAPDMGYAYELQYLRRPPSITNSSTTNTWLSDNAPDCLLYHSLIEGQTFLKNYEALPTYQNRAKEAMQELKFLCEGMQKVDSFRSTELRFS